MRKEIDFTGDLEKIRDLLYLNKDEFLKSYSYLTDEEYEATIKKIMSYVKTRLTARTNLKKKRDQNPEEEYRKANREYQRRKKE